MSIGDEARIGFLLLEDELDGASYGRHLRGGQVGLRVLRCVPSCDKQRIPLTQGHFQCIGEPSNHVTARLGLAGFNAAQMPSGHPHLECKVELAQPPRRAPFAQKRTHMAGR